MSGKTKTSLLDHKRIIEGLLKNTKLNELLLVGLSQLTKYF